MQVSMATPEAFMPSLRLRVTGPLEVTMREAIVEAAIAFCRRSELLCMTRPLTADAGDLIKVCDVEGMKACDIRHIADADGFAVQSGEAWFAMSPDEISVLQPITGATVTYTAEPVHGAKEVPSVLLDDHAETIAAGAAMLLYLQPDRPWSDPGRGSHYAAEFSEGIRRAYMFRRNADAPAPRTTNAPRNISRTFY